jgi:hypothetical protein
MSSSVRSAASHQTTLRATRSNKKQTGRLPTADEIIELIRDRG